MENGQWMQQAFMWVAFVAAIAVFILYMRWSNAKKKEHNVVVEYVPIAGHAKTFLAPFNGDRVELCIKTKEGKEMIGSHRMMSTNRVTTMWPGWGGSLVGVEMTKVYLYEGMLEDFIASIPVTNQEQRVKRLRNMIEKAKEKGTASAPEILEMSDALASFEGVVSYDLNNNPTVVARWLDEKISTVLAKFGNTLAFFADKLTKLINPMYVYLGLIVAIAVAAAAAVISYMNMQKIDVIMKGFGVQ